MNLRFWAHSAWTGLGLAVNGACLWAILALLARWTDAYSVGCYGLAQAVTAPLFIFSHAGQRVLMVNGGDGRVSLLQHLWLRLRTGLVAWLAAMTYCVLFADADVGLALVFAGVGAARLADSIIDACIGAYQRRERLDLASKTRLGQSLLPFAIFTAVLWWTGAPVPAVVAWGVARLAMSALMVAESVKFEQAQGAMAGESHWWKLVQLGFPLAVAAGLRLFTSNLPRVLVDAFAGRVALGVFAAAASLEMAGTLITVAATQTAAPVLAGYFQNGDERGYWRLLRQMGLLAAAVGVAGMLFAAVAGEWLLQFLFGGSYAGQGATLQVLLVAAAFANMNLVLITALSARHVLKAQPIAQIPAVLLGIPAGWFLITRHDIIGAAWTGVTMSAMQAIALGAVLVLSRRVATDGNRGVVS